MNKRWSKVTPRKEDKWISISDDEFKKLTKGSFRVPSGSGIANVVENSLARPELFRHVLNYLATMDKQDEFYELCEKIVSLKLKLYEATKMVYTCVSYTSQIKQPDLYKKLSDIFYKNGIKMKVISKYSYGNNYDTFEMSYV
jgi:hypothetical protein